MNKREIFDQVTHMETQIGALYEQLGDLKLKLTDLIEENHRLAVENEHLRQFLHDDKDVLSKASNRVEEQERVLPGEGIDNLARIYKEGFHICHMQFGSPRTGKDENCLFCLDLLGE